jgi:hypothetical protein
MNLPKIDLPTYELELPSTGKKINFRPFLVKEQKILLMAMESKKEIDAINAVKQIVSNCIVDKNFDVNEMSSFDLEYFFIQLRMRSIGEKISLSFTCKNTVSENQECNNLMQFEYDLSNTTIEKNPDHTKTIFFTKDVGVVMKYPSFRITENLVQNSKTKKTSVENALDLIVDCIDYFFDKENVYHVKEMSKQEITDYVENIPKTSFDKMEKFFDTMPQVKSIVNHKCNKCGFEHAIPVEGLSNFFE